MPIDQIIDRLDATARRFKARLADRTYVDETAAVAPRLPWNEASTGALAVAQLWLMSTGRSVVMNDLAFEDGFRGDLEFMTYGLQGGEPRIKEKMADLISDAQLVKHILPWDGAVRSAKIMIDQVLGLHGYRYSVGNTHEGIVSWLDRTARGHFRLDFVNEDAFAMLGRFFITNILDKRPGTNLTARAQAALDELCERGAIQCARQANGRELYQVKTSGLREEARQVFLSSSPGDPMMTWPIFSQANGGAVPRHGPATGGP